MKRSAHFSDDGRYRYSLRREWAPGEQGIGWVMLNPSTADATTDDPTIRRVVAFSSGWGYGWCEVINLFALRATDPRALVRAADPVGPTNDAFLVEWIRSRATLVAAWGVVPLPLKDRVGRLLELAAARPLACLGMTRDGSPRHPLHMARDARLSAFTQARGGPVARGIARTPAASAGDVQDGVGLLGAAAEKVDGALGRHRHQLHPAVTGLSPDFVQHR